MMFRGVSLLCGIIHEMDVTCSCNVCASSLSINDVHIFIKSIIPVFKLAVLMHTQNRAIATVVCVLCFPKMTFYI